MLIANPLYDVVFKFLMEDARVARLLIGQIIGEKIGKLTPPPPVRAKQRSASRSSVSLSWVTRSTRSMPQC